MFESLFQARNVGSLLDLILRRCPLYCFSRRAVKTVFTKKDLMSYEGVRLIDFDKILVTIKEKDPIHKSQNL